MNKLAQEQLANHYYNLGVQYALEDMKKNAASPKQILGAIGGLTLGGIVGTHGGGLLGSILGSPGGAELAASLGGLGAGVGGLAGTAVGGLSGYKMMADKSLIARLLNR